MTEATKLPYSQVYVLTGSTGSGKSTFANYLEDFGALIVSADTLAKEVVAPQSEGLNSLVKIFGDEILNSNQTLNRKLLHQKITQDKTFREKVEAVLHPLIHQRAKDIFLSLIEHKKSPIIYDCPLYFEKDLSKFGFKKSILLSSDEKLSLTRIMKRDNLSQKEAQERLNLQMANSEKEKLADIVIKNNGTLEELKEKAYIL